MYGLLGFPGEMVPVQKHINWVCKHGSFAKTGISLLRVNKKKAWHRDEVEFVREAQIRFVAPKWGINLQASVEVTPGVRDASGVSSNLGVLSRPVLSVFACHTTHDFIARYILLCVFGLTRASRFF